MRLTGEPAECGPLQARGLYGKYIKVFLMNDQRNKRGWQVPWDIIKRDAPAFKGFPGISYSKCDHKGCHLDHTERARYEDSLAAQEPYKIAEAVDVTFDEATHTAHAVMRITDDEFARKIDSHEMMFVSPSIWPNEGEYRDFGRTPHGEPYTDVFGFRPVHLAFVDKPAYGPDAHVKGQCDGDAEDCVPQLSAAEPGCSPCELKERMMRIRAKLAMERAERQLAARVNSHAAFMEAQHRSAVTAGRLTTA